MSVNETLNVICQPTGVQLQLVTGRRYMFYQEDPTLATSICNDLDNQIFSRPSLIVDSVEEVTAFPGHALLSITILVEMLPESFFAKERLSKTVTTQITLEEFESRRRQNIAKEEGKRGAVVSELEFVNGERLYLEFSEIAASAMGERNALYHLFSHPSLWCRRLGGGFTIWNTAHIVSWSHHPKLDVPGNAWQAELLPEPPVIDPEVAYALS